MKIASRREFLGGAAALAASPALAQLQGQMPVSGDVDVAIVGAGMAGIAAARRVASAGRSCALLEAADRIGGRVWSAAGTLGVVHDRGAHRLSASGRNPLVALGRLAGLRFTRPSPFRRLYVGMREARDSEYDGFTAARHRASRAIVAAGEAGLDLAAVRTLPELGDWRATVAFVLGPFGTSKDLEEISTVDFARADDQPDEDLHRPRPLDKQEDTVDHEEDDREVDQSDQDLGPARDLQDFIQVVHRNRLRRFDCIRWRTGGNSSDGEERDWFPIARDAATNNAPRIWGQGWVA